MSLANIATQLSATATRNGARYDELAAAAASAGFSVREGKRTSKATVLLIWQGGVARGHDLAHCRVSVPDAPNSLNYTTINKFTGTVRKTGDVDSKSTHGTIDALLAAAADHLNRYQPKGAATVNVWSKGVVNHELLKVAKPDLFAADTPAADVVALINEANEKQTALIENMSNADLIEAANAEKPAKRVI